MDETTVGLTIAALLAIGLLVSRVVARASRVTPTRIETAADLHTILRALLVAGHDRETLFVVWFPCHFEARVMKSSVPNQQATLSVEIRNAGENRAHYESILTGMERASLEYEEELDGKQRVKRARLEWPEGGPFVVTAVANALGVFESVLPNSSETRCAAACDVPSRWRDTSIAV
jgi:hypothetical protein